jgi:hypothetical protein
MAPLALICANRIGVGRTVAFLRALGAREPPCAFGANAMVHLFNRLNDAALDAPPSFDCFMPAHLQCFRLNFPMRLKVVPVGQGYEAGRTKNVVAATELVPQFI